MNVPRFLLAVIGVFVASGAVHIVLEGFVIADQVNAVMPAFNVRAEPHWILWLGRVLMSLVFCYIFLGGYEGKGVGEGVRYGSLMGLFYAGVGLSLYGFVDAPLSAALTIIIVDFLSWVVSGAVLALIYKPADSGAYPGKG